VTYLLIRLSRAAAQQLPRRRVLLPSRRRCELQRAGSLPAWVPGDQHVPCMVESAAWHRELGQQCALRLHTGFLVLQ